MQSRVEEARAMMRWGFESWQEKPLFEAGQFVTDIPVQLGKADYVGAVAPHKISMLGMRLDFSVPRVTVRYKGPVKAPLRRGDAIAELTVHYPDGLQHSFPLVAANDNASANFFERAWNGVRILWSKVA
jgi:D-alanyl-D-alanine carboxypeptidase (penicillin-binding protein 5/6)